MDPLIYVVAILGCSDSGQMCEPVAQEAVRYETRSACLAAAQAVLPTYSGADYPVVQARCETRGYSVAALKTARR